MVPLPRSERRHTDDRVSDQRSPFQRDRDRIIYTSAFRRLAWITQVVSAQEGTPFHNRLTHTLEVAQIGKRLAEKLLKQQPDQATGVGGVDPEVVEAAALAHDLGHPPFGHAAESELDDLVKEAGLPDGFEGNAQTFRIVTKLAVREFDREGLNLTRATLNAILKYPWFQTHPPQKRLAKWGAYDSEADDFLWVRGPEPRNAHKTAEADLMDFADDIAYAVHDVEDFYRTGIIPLDRLATNDDEADKCIDGTFQNLIRNGQDPSFGRLECKEALAGILGVAPVTEPYLGTKEHRALLRSFTAGLIARYINAITLQVPSNPWEPTVDIFPWAKVELFVFKQLTWYYVINDSSLATQQFGQKKIIRQLFEIFNDAATQKLPDLFPPGYREQITELLEDGQYTLPDGQIRLVTDLIAGMTEGQAISMYQRLTGMSLGTVLDRIVR